MSLCNFIFLLFSIGMKWAIQNSTILGLMDNSWVDLSSFSYTYSSNSLFEHFSLLLSYNLLLFVSYWMVNI